MEDQKSSVVLKNLKLAEYLTWLEDLRAESSLSSVERQVVTRVFVDQEKIGIEMGYSKKEMMEGLCNMRGIPMEAPRAAKEAAGDGDEEDSRSSSSSEDEDKVAAGPSSPEEGEEEWRRQFQAVEQQVEKELAKRAMSNYAELMKAYKKVASTIFYVHLSPQVQAQLNAENGHEWHDIIARGDVTRMRQVMDQRVIVNRAQAWLDIGKLQRQIPEEFSLSMGVEEYLVRQVTLIDRVIRWSKHVDRDVGNFPGPEVIADVWNRICTARPELLGIRVHHPEPESVLAILNVCRQYMSTNDLQRTARSDLHMNALVADKEGEIRRKQDRERRIQEREQRKRENAQKHCVACGRKRHTVDECFHLERNAKIRPKGWKPDTDLQAKVAEWEKQQLLAAGKQGGAQLAKAMAGVSTNDMGNKKTRFDSSNTLDRMTDQ